MEHVIEILSDRLKNERAYRSHHLSSLRTTGNETLIRLLKKSIELSSEVIPQLELAIKQLSKS